MRILSVVRQTYYGTRSTLEPMYVYFTEPLRQMGHEVATFDHHEAAERLGKTSATSLLVEHILKGAFDLVLYQTAGREPVDTSALRHLSERLCIIAWNSDDDWQWSTSTSRIYANFTFMVTTYPHVHESNRRNYPNLLLSQWGCHPPFGELSHPKDLSFSFAGSIYGDRNRSCRYLAHHAGLRCFGRGARLVHLQLPYFKGAFKLNALCGGPIDFRQVHAIWNRSRISYTPMGGACDSNMLQIKGRAFEMGCSGTLMLSELSPGLDRYYEPGKEFIVFDSLADCADKANFYRMHESERAKIAQRYYERTRREHLWEHRFRNLFAEVGLL